VIIQSSVTESPQSGLTRAPYAVDRLDAGASTPGAANGTAGYVAFPRIISIKQFLFKTLSAQLAFQFHDNHRSSPS
jgi:hypothetical protein